MSYREIQYLVEYKKYCEDSSKRGKSTKHINGRTYSNKYESFCNEYSKQIKVSPGEVDYVFLHIKQTGFIEEEFETESGDVDENDNTFDSLDVESKGYYITKEFLDFLNEHTATLTNYLAMQAYLLQALNTEVIRENAKNDLEI